jgi:uncharacterized protein with FMN-binding domain
MRRVLFTLGGTIAGLVMLLSFKTHGAAVPGPATAAGSTGAGSAGTAGTGTGTAAGTSPGQSGTAGGSAPAQGGQQITGNVANTAYGPVQVRVTVSNSKIVKVAILEQPTSTAHDIQIGDYAFPKLESETLAAQSARIDMVSGATYTSRGYIQSLQSALDNGV